MFEGGAPLPPPSPSSSQKLFEGGRSPPPSSAKTIGLRGWSPLPPTKLFEVGCPPPPSLHLQSRTTGVMGGCPLPQAEEEDRQKLPLFSIISKHSKACWRMEARKCRYFLKFLNFLKFMQPMKTQLRMPRPISVAAPLRSLVFPKLLESLEILENSSICWPPSSSKL